MKVTSKHAEESKHIREHHVLTYTKTSIRPEKENGWEKS